MERAAGVEPTLSAWVAAVLPLYDARMIPDGWEGCPVGGWHSARAFRRDGATGGNRTPDPLLTRQPLWPLSYSSN